MDAEGVGRERAAAAAPGDKTLADAGGLDSAQARSREPRALAEAVDAANGGQWPPRRGEELPRALTQRAAGTR